jgi:hypothetical protein
VKRALLHNIIHTINLNNCPNKMSYLLRYIETKCDTLHNELPYFCPREHARSIEQQTAVIQQPTTLWFSYQVNCFECIICMILMRLSWRWVTEWKRVTCTLRARWVVIYFHTPQIALMRELMRPRNVTRPSFAPDPNLVIFYAWILHICIFHRWYVCMCKPRGWH